MTREERLTSASAPISVKEVENLSRRLPSREPDLSGGSSNCFKMKIFIFHHGGLLSLS